MWFVVFFIKVAAYFLGGSHLSPRLQRKKHSIFYCQMCWSIKTYDQNLCHIYLYNRTLQCFTNCCFLYVFLNDSLFYFHIFPAAILLVKWNCPGGLSIVSISWYTQPSLSWELLTGAPGTSGCSCCSWFCFGSWDFTCIIWANGSSFRPSRFLLQSKSSCLLSLSEYFYR